MFWVIPVHWKGWLLVAAMLISTGVLCHLMLDVFESGTVGSLLSAIAFTTIAVVGITTAYIRTEKH